MSSLASLWLPTFVSAVLVFVVSSIIHMVLPWHKSDYPRVSNEDAVMDALRPLAIPPGDYMVPRPASMQEMRSPAFAERMARGPVFMLRMMPNGMRPMGGPLAQWFVYSLVVAWVSGHIAQRALPPNPETRRLFHTVSLSAFMGYAFALWQMSIWYRRPWLITIKSTIDGLIYAAITAFVFVWLWPK